MPYEPEPDTGENDEEEAPDIHTLKKNFEILHTNQNQGNLDFWKFFAWKPNFSWKTTSEGWRAAKSGPTKGWGAAKKGWRGKTAARLEVRFYSKDWNFQNFKKIEKKVPIFVL